MGTERAVDDRGVHQATDGRGARKHSLTVALMAVAAVCIRMAFALHAANSPFSDGASYVRYASLYWNGASTAYWPPGYPLLLGLIFRLAGGEAYWAVFAVQALCDGVAVMTVGIPGARIIGQRGSLWAAGALACLPSSVALSGSFMSETLATVLCAGSVVLLWTTQLAKSGTSTAIASGLAMGFGLLTRPALVCVPAALAVLALGSRRWRRELRWRRCALACTIAVLPLLGWAGRNYVLLDHLIPLATNGGVNFWIGNNAQATGQYLRADDLGFPDEGDEVRNSALGWRLGIEWVMDHPADWARLIPAKIASLWASDIAAAKWGFLQPDQAEWRLLGSGPKVFLMVAQAYYMVTCVAAAYGLLRARRSLWAQHMICVFVLWSLFHVAFFASGRFHAPLYPLLCIAAAAAFGDTPTSGNQAERAGCASDRT